jgi:regulator of sirC expression with transglutaminase-like and TPR domain
MTDDPLGYLRRVGQSGEGSCDIARAAVMLGILDHPQASLDPYLSHLDEITAAMRAEAAMIMRVGDGARAVAALLAGRLGYEGDRATYEDPRNADLVSVIDRRRGLPVALGILYIHAARAAGMHAAGLDTQGHFVVRFTHRYNDVTVDPFHGGGIVDREHMPAELRGSDAILAQPVSDTDVLLRLQNNLKLRALERGDGARGRDVAGRMVLLAPRRPDLWFDLARINEAMGILGEARNAYERCSGLARPGEALHNEAALALANLRRRLN